MSLHRPRLPGRTRGFTLLEMMVALGIAALASIALIGWNRASSTGHSAEAFSRKLQAELRMARAAAIGSNTETVVMFNNRERRFESDGKLIALPETMAVEVTAADAERRDENTIGIRFFPTGKSTGGEIRIAPLGSSKPFDIITVNWLTGHAASQRAQRP
jgi:general secretion pathway protein H